MSFRTHPVDPLQVVVAGAGSMGQAWLSTVLASPSVSLAGIADLNVALARSSGRAGGLGRLVVGP